MARLFQLTYAYGINFEFQFIEFGNQSLERGQSHEKVKNKKKVRKILSSLDIRINGNRPWDIQVHNPNFYERIFSGGSLALGETYMSGWGGFSKYAAQKYSVSVHGITVSREQVKYANKFYQGLDVKIELKDYQDLKEMEQTQSSI